MNVFDIKYEKCFRDKEKVECVMGHTAVHFVLEGEGFFNGEKITAGQGFIAFENEFSAYYPNKDNPWTYVWVRLSECEMLKDYGNIFSWKTEYKNEIINMVNRYKNGNRLYKIGCAYMLLSYMQNKAYQLSQEQKHIFEAENYIKLFYKEIKSAQQVADKLGLSRAYLRNLFYSEKGMSTKEYIIKTRLKHACNMLLTDYPVKIIAISVGYDDQLQFTRIFKKYMGVSPTEYRKNKV